MGDRTSCKRARFKETRLETLVIGFHRPQISIAVSPI